MPIIKFTDINKSFDQGMLFDSLSVQFYPGEKVGLIGSNGSGKTTLLKMILDQEEPDTGKVIKRRNLSIGYLPQEPAFDGEKTIIEEMHSGLDDLLTTQTKIEHISEKMGSLSGNALAETMKEFDRLSHAFEMNGGYTYEARVNTILAGVGFDQQFLHTKTSALSGGQLSRLGLAKVLLTNVDILLLDEPTNHLDLQGTVWLEKYLRAFDGAAIVISHDRYLLDSIAAKIVEIEGGKATVWKGNYSEFVTNKEIIGTQQLREFQSKMAMVERTRDFIARNKDQEGMRGTARGRAKRLERMLADDQFLNKPSHTKKINFNFAKSQSKSAIILRCEGLHKSFDDLVLFRDLSLDLLAGEKLGITGPNGTGKSTFLRLAMGDDKSTDGLIRMGKFLSIGYLDQHAKQLNPANTVLEEAKQAREELTIEAIRNRLGGFHFTGDDVYKTISQLSGGEQNRLMLCKLVLAEHDVLILDEPTNHLDIASKEALENALKAFNGAVIVVSHDRYFLDRVVDKLLVVGANELGKKQLGQCEIIEGGVGTYSRYAEAIDNRIADREKQTNPSGQTKKPKRARSENAAGRQTTPPELKQFNKFSVDQIEEMIMQAEEDIAKMQDKFGDESVYKDHKLLEELHAAVENKKNELNLLYQAYEFRA